MGAPSLSRPLRQGGDFDFARRKGDSLPTGFLLRSIRCKRRRLRRYSHPRLDRADTKLSYCNGEIGAGSSNITPYMVWPYPGPRWVAHTLQQMDGFRVETKRGGKTARAR